MAEDTSTPPPTEANQKVGEAIAKGLDAANVNVSQAVFGNVAGCIINFLFDAEVRQYVRDYCDECDKREKAERSKSKPKKDGE